MSVWLLRALVFACGLAIGHADAAVYHLVDNATAALSVPPKSVTIQTGTTGAPAANLSIQVIVGDSGSACTAQPVGSNNGVNWVSVGSAITVAAGGVTGGASVVATWAFWGATITSVTGSCTVLASG